MNLYCIICVKKPFLKGEGGEDALLVVEGAPYWNAEVMFEGSSYCTKHYLELLEWRKQQHLQDMNKII